MSPRPVPPTPGEATPRRRPHRVYDDGHEPDYRFSFANERTFLAWLRTALALMAAGVAVDVVVVPDGGRAGTVLALALVLLGVGATVLCVVRWARAERAMRHGRALPGFGLALALPVGLVVAGLALWLLLV